MMSCETVIPLLGTLVDGELSATEEQAVRAHLGACDRCSGRAEAIRALRSAVRSIRPERSDEGLEALRHRLRESPAPPSRSRARWTGLAAGLALLVAGSVWLSRDRPLSGPGTPSEPPTAHAATAPSGSVSSVADLSTPCARAMECGDDAQEVWPALDI